MTAARAVIRNTGTKTSELCCGLRKEHMSFNAESENRRVVTYRMTNRRVWKESKRYGALSTESHLLGNT